VMEKEFGRKKRLKTRMYGGCMLKHRSSERENEIVKKGGN